MCYSLPDEPKRQEKKGFAMTMTQLIVMVSIVMAWGCVWTCFAVLVGCKIAYRAMRREDPTRIGGDNGISVTPMREDKPKETEKRFDV